MKKKESKIHRLAYNQVLSRVLPELSKGDTLEVLYKYCSANNVRKTVEMANKQGRQQYSYSCADDTIAVITRIA